MTKEVRWGIIGCGNVTEAKSGPAFQKVKNSSLVAVMRRDGGKAEDYAARHGVAKWYDNAEQLINDKEVDAVYVATPPDSHKDYAVKVLQAGKPVYVEKPMARTVAECEEIIAASKAAGKPLYVAYYRRELPAFKKVQEILKNTGRIGVPTQVEVNLSQHRKIEEYTKPDGLPWRVQPDVSGGGLFYDLGSHQFDVLDMLLGEVEGVSGHASNPRKLHPCEEVVTASWKHPATGVLGVGSWNFALPSWSPPTDTIKITCTKGVIEFSSFDFAPVKVVTAEGVEEYPFPRPDHVQEGLIATIVAELVGEDGSVGCVSVGETAIRTNKVLEKLTAEYYGRA